MEAFDQKELLVIADNTINAQYMFLMMIIILLAIWGIYFISIISNKKKVIELKKMKQELKIQKRKRRIKS